MGLVIVFLIYSTIQNYRKGRIGLSDLIFWTLVWFGGLVAVFYPRILDPISALTDIKPINLFVYSALLMAFFLLYSMDKMQKLQAQNLEELRKALELEAEEDAKKKGRL